MMDWIVITLEQNKCKKQEFGLIFNILMKNMKCCFTYIMHTKDAKNKKIKIFKFSLALYQILFRMYSGLCKKKLVLVGSKCTIVGVIISTTEVNRWFNKLFKWNHLSTMQSRPRMYITNVAHLMASDEGPGQRMVSCFWFWSHSFLGLTWF